MSGRAVAASSELLGERLDVLALAERWIELEGGIQPFPRLCRLADGGVHERGVQLDLADPRGALRRALEQRLRRGVLAPQVVNPPERVREERRQLRVRIHALVGSLCAEAGVGVSRFDLSLSMSGVDARLDRVT